jgi:RsiW-degrading membrane proteinase PrsW (M82 family)
MTLLLINLFLAAIPSFILVNYFDRQDRQKPEPRALVWKLFFLGFFAVLPALFLEIFIGEFTLLTTGVVRNLAEAFIQAGLVEEGIKLTVIMLFIYRRREFDEIYDGIVYTITASLGFACFENLMYSFGSPATILIRGFTAVPLHAIASGIMGYYIGRSRYYPGHLILRGFTLAVLIHGLYDFFLFTGGSLSFLVFPLLYLGGRWLLRLGRLALAEDRMAGRS